MYENDQVYRRVLGTAAEIEAISEGHQNNLDAINGLFSSILGVTSDIERQKLLQDAEHEREEKLKKRRNAIAALAQTPFGEPGVTKKVSLLKYLCESTGMKKSAVLEHVNVGDFVLQGDLFTPFKDKFEKWNSRKCFLDLRSRNVTWNEAKAKKTEISLRDILTCSTTQADRISKKRMVQDDGCSVSHAFTVVTQKKTWYFSARSRMEADFWVAALQATCYAPQ